MKKVIGFILLLASSVAFAQEVGTVGDIANHVVEEIDQVPDLLGAFSYVFGVALGIKAILKFKEHNESKGQVKLGIPIILIVASALFLGLPTVLKMGIDTTGYSQVPGATFKYEY